MSLWSVFVKCLITYCSQQHHILCVALSELKQVWRAGSSLGCLPGRPNTENCAENSVPVVAAGSGPVAVEWRQSLRFSL